MSLIVIVNPPEHADPVLPEDGTVIETAEPTVESLLAIAYQGLTLEEIRAEYPAVTFVDDPTEEDQVQIMLVDGDYFPLPD